MIKSPNLGWGAFPRVEMAGDQVRQVIDAVPSPMLMADDSGMILRVNSAASKLFGYDRNDLVGLPVDHLLPDPFRQHHAAFVRSCRAEPHRPPVATALSLPGLRKGGQAISVEIALSPIVTQNGLCTLASIRDLGERHAAAERFRLAVEAAPNPMIMMDGNRRITLANRKAEALFGYDRAALLGKPADLLVPERFLLTPDAPAPTGRPEPFARCRDGSELPVEIGLNPIEMLGGMHTLVAIVDISRRRIADVAQSRLAAIVEYSADAILSKTLDGIITSWNQAAEHLFGYDATQAIGQPVTFIVPEQAQDEELGLLARIRNNEAVAHFATVRRRKDGREVDVSVSLSPIRNDTGDVVGVSSIVRDITEARKRDIELQRSNAELEQFAYIASHDLQEPLRMVANYTELLGKRYEGQLDDRADRYIHYASEGARRMQQLVSDLLAYSRVGSQGRPFSQVASGPVLARVAASLRRLVRESGATIVADDLPTVLADEIQLGQLFQNLISNALKFRSEAPPKIVVAAQAIGNRWRFSVADNGIGMDMQYADRIFQMFQRLHPRDQFGGSGIGLAIAKRIVERHGGRIWLESEPGTGSTFFFTLQSMTGDSK